MDHKNLFTCISCLTFILLLLPACGAPPPTSTSAPAADTASPPTATPVPPTDTAIPDPTDTPIPPPTDTPAPTPTEAPPPYPVARGISNMAYDAGAGKSVIVGGELYYDADEGLEDTWAYDAGSNTWTQMTSPGANGFGSMAYDPVAERTVFYLAIGTPPYWKMLEQTWTYDLNSDSWTNMQPSKAPEGRFLAPMVYDSESERMIFFGGIGLHNSGLYDDTWAYDTSNNTWTQMNPAASPSKREAGAMAYHPTLDRVVMFGGNSDYGLDDETWLYDYNSDSWEMIDPPQSPSRRAYSAMVYVPSIERIVLFGGSHPIESATSDTWLFDHEGMTWVELHPDPAPSKRAFHAMVYDASVDKIVLFGGGPDWYHYTNETWFYDPHENTWTDMTPAQ